MCKIAMIPNITDKTRADALKLMVALEPWLSDNDNDGFGYMAVTKDNKLFGERWHINEQAFVTRPDVTSNPEVAKYGDAINENKTYSKFGSVELDKITSVALHARMATSGKEFVNTHPFVEGHTALIHNGVIHNTHELTFKHSTCDSEGILHEYCDSMVNVYPEKIQRVADALVGYYACAVYSKGVDGTYLLDIFKDRRANLSAAYVKELETVVFCTSLDILKNACQELGFTVESTFTVSGGVMIRIDLVTQDVTTFKFTPSQRVETKRDYAYGMTHEDMYKAWEERDADAAIAANYAATKQLKGGK